MVGFPSSNVPKDLVGVMTKILMRNHDGGAQPQGFEGLNAAPIIPVTQGRGIDQDKFHSQLTLMVNEANVSGFFLDGMNGEGNQTTEHHVQAALDVATQVKERHKTTLVGTAFRDTQAQILKRIELYAKSGKVDAVMYAHPLKESSAPADFHGFAKKVARKAGDLPVAFYNAGLGNPALNFKQMRQIGNVLGEQFAAVKDTQGTAHVGRDYAAAAKEQYPGFAHLQGNSRHDYTVFTRLERLRRQGKIPHHFGGVSGGSNVIPLAQITQILHASIENMYDPTKSKEEKAEYRRLAQDISKYMCKEGFGVLEKGPWWKGTHPHGGIAEPRVWGNMSYVEGFSGRMLDQRIEDVSHTDKINLGITLKQFEAKRDYFLRRYELVDNGMMSK